MDLLLHAALFKSSSNKSVVNTVAVGSSLPSRQQQQQQQRLPSSISSYLLSNHQNHHPMFDSKELQAFSNAPFSYNDELSSQKIHQTQQQLCSSKVSTSSRNNDMNRGSNISAKMHPIGYRNAKFGLDDHHLGNPTSMRTKNDDGLLILHNLLFQQQQQRQKQQQMHQHEEKIIIARLVERQNLIDRISSSSNMPSSTMFIDPNNTTSSSSLPHEQLHQLLLQKQRSQQQQASSLTSMLLSSLSSSSMPLLSSSCPPLWAADSDTNSRGTCLNAGKKVSVAPSYEVHVQICALRRAEYEKYAMKKEEEDVVASNENTANNSNVNETFPRKLYRMLIDAEKNGEDHIVSFVPNGCAFIIHDSNQFVSQILHKCFTTKRLASFQRQLNLYGFKRIVDITSSCNGGYYHDYFLKDCPKYCELIKRHK